MNFSKPLTALLLTTALMGANYASADDRAVVHSSNGNVVTGTNGNCVRTVWDTGHDECGIELEPKEVTIHKVRRAVAQEERTIYFDFNQAGLTAASKRKLDSLADVLKSQDDVKQAHIVGFADRIGSSEYNDRLSKKRAENVRKYILSRGFIKADVAETRWFGEKGPIATNCPDTLSRTKLIQCLQKDRRVEVEIDYLPEGPGTAQR